MTTNRYCPSPETLRIAFGVTSQFPDATQGDAYAELSAIAAGAHAQAFVLHSQAAADATVPATLAGGHVRPHATAAIQEIHRADFDHFRRIAPERCEQVLEQLAHATGQARGELADRYEVLHAFSVAREVQALDIHYLHAWYNYDQALNSYVAATLLGLPRGISLCQGFDGTDWDLRLPRLHLETADLVVAADSTTHQDLLAAHPAVRDRLILNGDAALIGRIEAAVARSLPQERGLIAAYGTRRKEPALDLPIVPFVMIGAERTGSNLLIQQLGFDYGHELFNPDYVDADFLPIDDHSLQHDPRLVKLRRDDPGAFLRAVWSPYAKRGFGCAGLKLFYYHAAIHHSALEYLLAQRDVKVIHVLRRNRMRRFVSHRIADATGSWYRGKMSKEPAPTVEPIRIDIPEMFVDFRRHEQYEERFAALFKEHEYLETTYEEFSRDKDLGRRDLLDFLGATAPPPLKRPVKTGRSRLADVIENYDELREALARSPWADCTRD